MRNRERRPSGGTLLRGAVVEYDVADLVDGAIAFERTAERVPFGSIAGALDTDLEALNRVTLEEESADDERDATDRRAGGSEE